MASGRGDDLDVRDARSALESANVANIGLWSAGAQTAYVTVISGSRRTLQRVVRYFLLCAASAVQYGNAGRDTIEGPGLVDFDLNAV